MNNEQFEFIKSLGSPKWVAVKDNLPPCELPVMWFGCDKRSTSSGIEYTIDYISKHELGDNCIHWWHNFTHWMPLPEAPVD